MTDATTSPIHTRRDVWKLPEWDSTVLWYARAVGEMMKRPIADPTSWRYQGAIHGYDPGQDPFARAGEALPSTADQKRFWSQCQHFSWFFLPWHRMYLHFFEQIVRAAVVKLGGPADWALPYWNYSAAPSHGISPRRLPAAFRAAHLPDGSANPLHVTQRDPHVMAGGQMHATAVSLRCLKEPLYTGAGGGGAPGFGGPRTVFSHVGNVSGSVEMTPHGDIHMAVGGASVGGWMTSFETAALDPIFWLHHANIDRLWEVWRRRGGHPANPADSQWMAAAGALFELHDAGGAIVKMTPAQVVDTTAAPLFYQYEDTADPLPPTHVGVSTAAHVSVAPSPPEMIGSLGGIDLDGGAAVAAVPIHLATGPSSAAFVAGASRRVFLNLENVTGQGRVASYAVYLNVPAGGADPSQHESLLAGALPMFGVAEASRTDGGHSGGGITYVLDITDLVEQLKAVHNWDPARLQVSFVPLGASQPDARVRVGRVSVFHH